MKKMIPYIFISFFFFVIAKKVEAVCAICTLSICLGVGLSRWLGIDDAISGLWIGGLIICIIILILNLLDKKKIKFKFRELSVSLLIYSVIVYMLYFQGMIGIHGNTLFCVDKLLFGITFGSITLLAGIWAHDFLKKKNNNKIYFNFQKVIIPVSLLILVSAISYFIVR